MDAFFQSILGPDIGLTISILVKIAILMACLILTVAYLTYFERKVIGYMQMRVGPNVTGPLGLIQPFADVFKLLIKEVIRPSAANRGLFILGPIITLLPAFAVWAVIPFSENLILAALNVAILYLLALSSAGVYGVILGGWASNSKYSFLGAMRASAQMISYELPMSFAIISVVLVAGSMNFIDIVRIQQGAAGLFSWNWLPLLPMFIIYFISGVAETNRAPFDVAEGESELVAGFHTEYSGFAFAVFFLSEYINMMVISALTALLFLGGWLSPFPESWGWIGQSHFLWMLLKMAFVLFVYFWFRATFPRYRYDQIMRLGWKVFIPITLIWLIVVAYWMTTPYSLWN
ncbi:MAG: NADH-quinone oxidoreductase subunit NuoH [Neisseriaceae bacterium]|nr:NADH-quinone oxidoreductase subunit NuoH [Neisseriaceae bacterium]